MRDFKGLIKKAKGEKNHSIVVSRSEMKNLRETYDKKFTLLENRLEIADLVQGRALLNGIQLSRGEWDMHHGVKI